MRDEYAEFMDELAMEVKPKMMNLTTYCLPPLTCMDLEDVELYSHMG